MQANPLTRKLILLVAMLLLIPLYFIGHNTGELAIIWRGGFARVGGMLLDVLTLTAIAIISGGVGRTLLGQLPSLALDDELSAAERVALQSLLGLGIISSAALVMGLLGAFNRSLWLMLALLGVLTIRGAIGWLREMTRVVRSALAPQTVWTRFIVVFCGILLGAALLLALAPPFNWDAMTYHLEGPHRYLQAGRIAAQPDNHFLGFPQGMEILYGVAMALFGRDTAAAPLHWYTGVLGLLATAGIVRRHTDRATGYLVGLIFLSSYGIWELFTIPYVDLAMFAYGAGVFIAARRWHVTDKRGWLALAGVFAGFALGVKYTAAAIVLPLGVFVLVRQPRRVIQNGLIVGGMLALCYLPWAAKGFLLYENPVYPYVFGGLNWDATRSMNFSAGGGGLLDNGLAWMLPTLPFSATIFGAQQRSPFALNIGAFLLTLPFLLLLTRHTLDKQARSLADDATIFALPLLAFWYLMAAVSGIGAQPRLVLVGGALAAILGALAVYGVSRWRRLPLNMWFILRVVLALVVLLSSFEYLHHWSQTRITDYLASTIDDDTYLERNLGVYYVALQRLDELPADSTVRFMWEPKSYYCPDDITCIPDVLYDHWYRDILTGTDSATVMEQWRDGATDYLLVADGGGEVNVGYSFWLDLHTFARDANERFPAYVDEYLRPVWSESVYTLYEWRDQIEN